MSTTMKNVLIIIYEKYTMDDMKNTVYLSTSLGYNNMRKELQVYLRVYDILLLIQSGNIEYMNIYISDKLSITGYVRYINMIT